MNYKKQRLEEEKLKEERRIQENRENGRPDCFKPECVYLAYDSFEECMKECSNRKKAVKRDMEDIWKVKKM